MSKISYLKIQNFKIFGDEIQINFDQDSPTVLVGANNSGKTTAIQALALWSWAIKIWYEKKKNVKSEAQRNKGVALNRLEIAQVPIKETRFFWNNTQVRQNSNDNIQLTICLGFLCEGQSVEIGMIFKYHSPELMYCQPTPESYAQNKTHNNKLFEYANNLIINLLYPMSGLEPQEFVLQKNAIQTFIGTGQPAKVLRNLCYHLHTENATKWERLVILIRKLFAVDIKKPSLRATGAIELAYNYTEKSKQTDYDLDISLAGRGQQQMILVLAYLLSNPNTVLLIDEPDAHLEILRQNQLFAILKQVSNEMDCQLILVSHSEVVLNEAQSLIFLMDGKVNEISDKTDQKFIKNALRDYGIEHYYKAKLQPHILYIEGSTDKDMLLAFAEKLKHPLVELLNDKLFYYFTQNEMPSATLENTLDNISGAYKTLKPHFQALQSCVKELKAVAIFDGDNKNRKSEISQNLAILYWEKYEFENYFINPKTLIQYAQHWFDKEQTIEKGLWLGAKMASFEDIVETHFLLPVLDNNTEAVRDYKKLPESLQKTFLKNAAKNLKYSELAESVFKAFSEKERLPVLLRKGSFYKMIPFLTDSEIEKEVIEKLDKIYEYLKPIA